MAAKGVVALAAGLVLVAGVSSGIIAGPSGREIDLLSELARPLPLGPGSVTIPAAQSWRASDWPLLHVSIANADIDGVHVSGAVSWIGDDRRVAPQPAFRIDSYRFESSLAAGARSSIVLDLRDVPGALRFDTY